MKFTMVAAIEGQCLYPGGPVIARGAFNLDQGPVEVKLGEDGPVIGYGSNFTRDEVSGKVTMDVEVMPEYEEIVSTRYTLF